MFREHIPDTYGDRHVCILGLGFVGLTLAAVMADVGFDVTGVEIRDEVLDKLVQRSAHFFEPGLNDTLARALDSGRLRVSKAIPENCSATVFIITVGTPLGPDGRANLGSVRRISEEIAAKLKDGDLIILRSTVKIGTTQSIVRPILEKSGKKFEIAFCPERTVEGQAMSELRYLPQIIGASSLATVNRAASLFGFLTPTVVRVSSAETAEMIKLVDNSKRDVMFAFANELAGMCDKIGISAAEVIRSGRFGYARTDLPMPGPVGGPCLSKDSYILAESVESVSAPAQIILAARHMNERQPKDVAAFLAGYAAAKPDFPERPKIALLGIAFKGRPATDDVRGTTAVNFYDALKNAFPSAAFVAHDPVVDPATLRSLDMTPSANVTDALRDTSIAIILNSHPFYGSLQLNELSGLMRVPGVIYDCWNNYVEQPIGLARGVKYIALGSHALELT